MVKSIIKNIIYKLFAKNYIDIIDIIKDYDYISFDVFDTLIKRNIYKPSNIFDIIERKTNIINFKEKRIKAESIARNKSKYEEITLKDIYNELDIENKKDIYNLEIEMELSFCTTNKKMAEIYNYCLENNKKIFITSDMYLPKDVVEKILKSNGYTKYDKLYLSNEYKLTKSSGNLFKKLLEEEKISTDKLVHIGDTIKSDYLSCKKLNIKSILIKRNINNTLFTSKKNKNLDYNILSSFINNHINPEWNEYEKFGYEVLGPILYSFTTWLHTKIKEDKIDKIYFLARDAKLIMDSYILKYKDKIPLYYIYTSRKASILSNLINIKDYDDIINRTKSLYTKVSTIKDMLHIFEIDLQLPYQNKNLKNLTKKEKEDLFNNIKVILEEKGQLQHEYLNRYLKQNNFNGNIAIADIGWSGTIQYNFQKYIIDENTKLFGYYYGIFNTSQNKEYEKLNRKGFLFDKNNMDYQSIINLNLGLFELMFLSTDASTKAYQLNKNLVEPLFSKKTNIDNKYLKNIIDLQECAKKYIIDVVNCRSTEMDILSKETSFINYCDVTLKPKLKTIKMFKNIEFQNVYTKKLIEHNSFLYYVFHPRKFYKDFGNSTCKIMFMKDVFKIPLPYYKILKQLYVKTR